jgi:hypothetical protein
MPATSLNSESHSFHALMGNGVSLRIPRFQRDYCWTEEEWSDLWQDIENCLRPGGELAHYMGYLVLQDKGNRIYDVIDGQQRLTTLSLVVLAALNNLRRLVDAGTDAAKNRKRIEELRRSYIGLVDPVSLVSSSKLTLNRNTDGYYQTYIVPLGHLPKAKVKAAERTLRQAFEWFDARIAKSAAASAADPGDALARFVVDLADRLFFTVIYVTNELNAYKVFETLNARGVRLSATDLLKNWLFTVLHRDGVPDRELDVLEERWAAIVARLGKESFSDFLRAHWNSRHPFQRQADLFKTIRAQVTAREMVFTLLRELEQDLDVFLALAQPESSHWSPPNRRNARLLAMFNVSQPYSLLLAAHRACSEQDFGEVLRACVVVSLRYNVIGGQPPNEQERVYGSIAAKLPSGASSRAAEIIAGLAPVYPSDAVFKASFTDKSLATTQSRNKRIVRYLLASIEQRLASGPELDLESDELTIEHILPENPDDGWESFPEDDQEAFVYRLGNLTLLRSADNRGIGNRPYADKLAAYAQSPITITKKIAADNSEWTPQKLDARQQWMATQATAIWRLNQLS